VAETATGDQEKPEPNLSAAPDSGPILTHGYLNK
jgi:hypothetical protein